MKCILNSGKRSVIKAVFLLIGALAVPGAAVPQQATFDKMNVGAEVRNIEIETAGEVTVLLEKSAGSLGVEDLKYEQADFYPVTATVSGDTIKLKIAGNKTWLRSGSGKMRASLRLLLPEGKNIRISGGSLKISGQVSALALKLSAGVLTAENMQAEVGGALRIDGGVVRLDATVNNAASVKVSGGAVSGKLRVPETAKLDTGRRNSKLKVYYIAGQGTLPGNKGR